MGDLSLLVSFPMTTAKKKPAKKPAAKKAPAKKAPAKKKPAAPKAAKPSFADVKAGAKKSTFADTNVFFEEIAAQQIAQHAEKIEELIDSIPAQVTVDARGVKSWLRKFFKGLSK